MSPSPTRLNRRNADDTAGDICRRHPNVGAHVGRLQGAMERTQPDHDIGIDLRDARTRTATGNLPSARSVQHMNEGRHGGMPRELTLMSTMPAEFP
jgi:hypothetical protein